MSTQPATDHVTIPNVVRIEPGEGGLPRVVVTNHFATAHVYLLGAHVAHFQPTGEAKPVLWMSAKSPFAEGKSIRGGVPICWPWFGPHATRKDLASHGCVRMRSWSLLSSAQLADGRTRLELGLESSAETLAQWPYEFSLRLIVTVGTALDLELITTNTGNVPFNYEEALHTYFAVGDVRQTTVRGLDGVGYLDKVGGVNRRVQSGDVAVTGEVTRIYFNDGVTTTINDAVWNRRIVITKGNAKASVVWSPWSTQSAGMPEILDLWPNFICVETANCIDVPVTLLPGTAHATRASYRVER